MKNKHIPHSQNSCAFNIHFTSRLNLLQIKDHWQFLILKCRIRVHCVCVKKMHGNEFGLPV